VDFFSRYIVSWELDQTLAQAFVMAAVHRALAQATPVIWNSDQGSHFISPQYTSVLLAAGVQIGMDGKGRALDNIFVERPSSLRERALVRALTCSAHRSALACAHAFARWSHQPLAAFMCDPRRGRFRPLAGR
jgi:transposase InsO family protein